jgi:hypothetical protein
MVTVTLIQSMLAPAVMISACGLLLLSMNNKYSLIIDRIRSFNLEKRLMAEKGITGTVVVERTQSIDRQLTELRKRVLMVRNAVIGYSSAVGFFILTSFGIGIQQWFPEAFVTLLSLVFFLSGMLAILVGALFAALDAWRGYRVVMIEMDSL